MNLAKMMKQAQELQQRMAEMQEELGRAEVEGSAGGGLVKVTMSGKQELRRVTIDPSLATPGDIEVLEDLIVAAVNDARAKAEERAKDEMAKLTGGLNLPPGLGLPF